MAGETAEVDQSTRAQEIRKEIDSTRLALKPYEEEVNPLFEKLTDEEQERLIPLLDEVQQGQLTVDEARAQLPHITPTELGILDVHEKASALISKLRNLSEEYERYEIEEMKQLVEDFYSRINYQQILERISIPDEQPKVQMAIRILSKLRRIQLIIEGKLEGHTSRDILLYGATDLRMAKDDFAKWGFLTDKKDQSYQNVSLEDEMEVRKIVYQEATEFAKNLSEHSRLKFIYNSPGRNSNGDNNLSLLCQIAAGVDSNGQIKEGDFVDPLLLGRLNNALRRESYEYLFQGIWTPGYQYFSDYLERVIPTNPDQIYDDIKIEGFEAKEGEKLAITQDGVLKFLKDHVPSFFLRRIASIKIVPEKAEDPREGETVISGLHKPRFDEKGEYIGGDAEIYRSVSFPGGTESSELQYAQMKILDTLMHEVGHSVHRGLTLDEMASWEQTMAIDPTAVNWYVEASRKEDDWKGKKEDFCDSFMLFFRFPAVLAVISYGRFEFMKSLALRYTKLEHRGQFEEDLNFRMNVALQIWNERGWTREDIVKLYTQ